MEAILKLYREQLLYDIANYAYIEGHKREVEGSCPITAHLITDITAEGNADRVDRILSAAHARAVEMLRQYTYQPNTAESVDDMPWTPEVYRIELHLPDTVSSTTVHLLSRLTHEYMVSLALADWLSIVSPQSAKVWADKAAETASSIGATCRSVTGTLKRRPSPW